MSPFTPCSPYSLTLEWTGKCVVLLSNFISIPWLPAKLTILSLIHWPDGFPESCERPSASAYQQLYSCRCVRPRVGFDMGAGL